MLLLATLGMLTPVLALFAPLKPARPAPLVAEPPPPPSPWRQVTPDGLGKAAPQQFYISEQKALPTMASGSPIALSPDGNWLAYPTEEGTLSVFDLSLATVAAQLSLVGAPAALNWSPDSASLMVLGASNDGSPLLYVVDRDGWRRHLLLRPTDRDLPAGPLQCAFASKVVFFPADEPALWLDLDWLRLYPLADHTDFNPVDAWTREKRLTLPGTPVWRFELSEAPSEFQVAPRRDPDRALVYRASACLALSDANAATQRCFPEVDLRTSTLDDRRRMTELMVNSIDVDKESIHFRLVHLPSYKEVANCQSRYPRANTAGRSSRGSGGGWWR